LLITIKKLEANINDLQETLKAKLEEYSKLSAENSTLKETIDQLKENLKVQEEIGILLANKDKTINTYRAEIETLKAIHDNTTQAYNTKEHEFNSRITLLHKELSSIINIRDNLQIENTGTVIRQTNRIEGTKIEAGEYINSI
jgi:chromosome segregation ATPase